MVSAVKEPPKGSHCLNSAVLGGRLDSPVGDKIAQEVRPEQLTTRDFRENGLG